MSKLTRFLSSLCLGSALLMPFAAVQAEYLGAWQGNGTQVLIFGGNSGSSMTFYYLVNPTALGKPAQLVQFDSMTARGAGKVVRPAPLGLPLGTKRVVIEVDPSPGDVTFLYFGANSNSFFHETVCTSATGCRYVFDVP